MGEMLNENTSSTSLSSFYVLENETIFNVQEEMEEDGSESGNIQKTLLEDPCPENVNDENEDEQNRSSRSSSPLVKHEQRHRMYNLKEVIKSFILTKSKEKPCDLEMGIDSIEMGRMQSFESDQQESHTGQANFPTDQEDPRNPQLDSQYEAFITQGESQTDKKKTSTVQEEELQNAGKKLETVQENPQAYSKVTQQEPQAGQKAVPQEPQANQQETSSNQEESSFDRQETQDDKQKPKTTQQEHYNLRNRNQATITNSNSKPQTRRSKIFVISLLGYGVYLLAFLDLIEYVSKEYGFEATVSAQIFLWCLFGVLMIARGLIYLALFRNFLNILKRMAIYCGACFWVYACIFFLTRVFCFLIDTPYPQFEKIPLEIYSIFAAINVYIIELGAIYCTSGR
ncbi:Schizosaccharomyces pombe specific protein [Schizosaccharomyces pombe]|uniref:Meiotically up-regulated gene 126 protein n=1 Tax=Schizosaccharomyces pombe (strain 972 / ATCC 24843) TaxID=284812 RepID=MU126_SCHPO|nr:protein mug126 [Schizosaccharomyces pombe]O36020.2 RecName: Full=Meiotically up-regulated gene 126 protein [Schizosaccharomyces pombe 972h-]CAB11711.2 sequence orphan [Schizosaccharomyces pombe]|eukprot:NP_001342855.1 protein mug126 [Schizosaccharomyces pombe]